MQENFEVDSYRFGICVISTEAGEHLLLLKSGNLERYSQRSARVLVVLSCVCYKSSGPATLWPLVMPGCMKMCTRLWCSRG